MNIFILFKYSQVVRYRDIDLDGNLLNSLYTSRGEGYRVDYGTVDYTEEFSNIKQKSISTKRRGICSKISKLTSY